MTKRAQFLFYLILIITLLIPLDVIAQSSPSEIEIISIDEKSFPEIKVAFRVTDFNMEPVTNLNASSINIFENQQPVEFEIAPGSGGIRAIFIIDAGVGIYANGATKKSRLSEIKEAINTFIVTMSNNDDVMLLTQEGEQSIILSGFTSSPVEISGKLDSYQPPATTLSNAYIGITRALTELENVRDGKPEYVFFFSSGIQSTTETAKANFERLTSNSSSPSIHTVLVRAAIEKMDDELREIADITNGSYFFYSTTNILDQIYSQIASRRIQYSASYRSTNPQSGVREVIIKDSLEKTQSAKSYNIEVSPPIVTLQEPATGSLIIRRVSVDTENTEELEPSSTTVVANISWPDQHPRKITNATLLIDSATSHNISNVDFSDKIEIPWDLRGIKAVGDNAISLQVEITDELGLTSLSVPTAINVSVEKPKTSSVLPIVSFISLGLGILAVALVIIFRKQIVAVSEPVFEGVKDFIDSTIRRTSSVPIAFLEATEGIDATYRKTTFELYGTTIIGRSRRHVDLSFHSNEDKSPISRMHCTLLEEDEIFSLRDEDSEWGTFLNGKKLAMLEPEELHDNDVIDIAPLERGGIRFIFRLANPFDDTPAGGEEHPSEEDFVTAPRRNR